MSVKKVAYDENSTDLIGPLTSAGATSADMVIPYSDSSGCVNLAKGLKQLGITDAKKIVSAPLCLNGQVAAGLGGDFPIWTYAIASSLYGDPTDPGMARVHEGGGEVHDARRRPGPVEHRGLRADPDHRPLPQPARATARHTPTSILAKAKAFTGPVALGAPSLACGKYPSAPAVCNDRAQFFQYHGKHVFKKVASWLQPPS